MKKRQRKLLEAIIQSDFNTVRKMILKGVNVNALKSSNSPLHVALSERNMAITELLWNADIDLNIINTRDIRGNTLLHLAVSAGFESIVSALLEKGVSANKVNSDLESPLFIAIIKRYREIALKLVEYVKLTDKSMFINAFELSIKHGLLDVTLKLANKPNFKSMSDYFDRFIRVIVDYGDYVDLFEILINLHNHPKELLHNLYITPRGLSILEKIGMKGRIKIFMMLLNKEDLITETIYNE